MMVRDISALAEILRFQQFVCTAVEMYGTCTGPKELESV